MAVNTEIVVSRITANETISLIEEYLFKGGSGFNSSHLEEMLTALGEADRIVIQEGSSA